jgi:acetoin utilization deacetylase AcuC-like enzyme
VSKTAFYWDEYCFWHSGGNYASVAPVGGLVQPLAAGGLPESPETKRRLKSLMDVTGLIADLDCPLVAPANEEDLRRIHPVDYLDAFKALCATGGGEFSQGTPFGPDSFNIAALSAGLVKGAMFEVLNGALRNAYALSRPPGHHCLPSEPMGFCLLANIAIAIEAAIAEKKAQRFAVVDWDVHHGNGTEAIFIERDDVLTISLHQENNYPRDTGMVQTQGFGAGEGFNINIPLMPGGGHDSYLYAFERIVTPALRRFSPDAIIVACGFDASGLDPLSRMLASAATYRILTERTMALAGDLCGGRLVLAHEGGYSEVYVPFCGHAVIQTLAGSSIDAPDPFDTRLKAHQPNARFQALQRELIDEFADLFDLT